MHAHWELTLALPRDNPWRNDLRPAGQEGTRFPPGSPVAARGTLLEQTYPAAVGVPVLVHAHHLEA